MKKKIIWTISIVAMIVIVFWCTYYYIMNKSYGTYKKDLDSYISQINSINKSSINLVKGTTIDPSKAKLELPKKIEDLKKIESLMVKMTPGDKYINSHKDLLSGLDNNVLFYKQCYEIVNKPEAPDLSDSLSNLKLYFNNFKNIYKGSSEISNFYEAMNNYVSEQIKLKKNKDIEKSQNSDYINSIDSLLSEFLSVKTNFTPYAVKARNNLSTYDDVIVQLNKNRDALDSIKSEFSNVTVPQKAVTVHKLFGRLLNDYDQYTQNFSYALINEKSQGKGNSIEDKDIQALYATTDGKFSSVETDYQNFIRQFQEFKESK